MGEMAEPSPKRGAVVVTGASSGIGHATAHHLRSLGFEVFAGVRKDADAERLRGEGLTPARIDVTDQGSIDTAAREVEDAVGDRGLAGLVNNAGVVMPAPLEALPVDELRHQLEVNVVGQLAVTQAFLPLLRGGRGRIVNIGSIGGRVASPSIGAYNASKFAMEAITDVLRQELRPWGIWVSIVEPGPIETDIWSKGSSAADELEQQLPKEHLERYAPLIQGARRTVERVQRLALPPEKVAERVAHALTARRPRARYVLGRDSRVRLALSAVLPTRVEDALIRRVMNI